MQATERLAELIHNKHQVLTQLRELGLRQANLVAVGDTTSLLKLLAVKQQLIVALQGLERELSPCHEENPDERVWSSPEQRAECARQASASNELLREIVNLEKSSAEIMTTRRNDVAQQLQQVHAAAHVRGAYEAQRRSQV
jgi:hypothetical protein